MRATRAVLATLVLALATAGCVSKSKYQAAVQESEQARAELQRVQAEHAVIEQQLKAVKEETARKMADAERVQAEAERLKAERDKERAEFEGRVKELSEEAATLDGQLKALRREYQAAEKEHGTLKATVARYQKELKDLQQDVGLAAGGPFGKPAPPSGPAGRSLGQEMGAPDRAGPGPAPLQAQAPQPAPPPSAVGQAATGSPKGAVGPGQSGRGQESSAEQESPGFFGAILNWILSLWQRLFS